MTDQLRDDLTTALGSAYQIERELTGGGMSRVFVAREQALGREVVIKVLPPELSAGLNRERFRREIQVAAHLSHPYIVPLLHAGEAGELLWFTMPFISGTSLRDKIEQDGALGVRETVRLVHDVVEALAFAHSRGVIHRDIKPGNILTDGKHAMVTDFGVAKALGAALPFTGVAGHTTSGMAIGTPAYMAPEQLAADPSADHRVDLYAVGLLMYELLAGVSPFDAPSPTATMTAQLTRTPASLAILRADVPPKLADLVTRLLAKNPEDRPADAATVLAELEGIGGSMLMDAHRETSGEKTAAGRPKSWTLVAAAVVVTSLIGVGLWATGAGTWGRQPGAARVETLPVQTSRDGNDGQPLLGGTKPLTRADSLAIASALRDELARIDPEPTTAQATEARRVDSGLSLDRQVAIADSLVRAKLHEINAQTSSTIRREFDRTRFPSSGIGPTPGSESVRRVMIVSAPTRNPDVGISTYADSLTHLLTERLGESSSWDLVPSPTGRFTITEGEAPPADILVTVGASPASQDSIVLHVGIRNLEPGSSFGYRVIASPPTARSEASAAYRNIVRDALGTLESARRTSRGSAWQFDQGRRPPTPPERP
ncbi:MAG TPA: serine/threonine-protein kinase [Gemmatimonadales bacterium]|nr:serine/threonine-protein kinase [Gemmatimonadales bacterium]